MKGLNKEKKRHIAEQSKSETLFYLTAQMKTYPAGHSAVLISSHSSCNHKVSPERKRLEEGERDMEWWIKA